VRVYSHYVFEKVKYRGTAYFVCPVCGKRFRRDRTFTATVNPWNVNPDGSPRTAGDIRLGLRLQAEAWVKVTEEEGYKGLAHAKHVPKSSEPVP